MSFLLCELTHSTQKHLTEYFQWDFSPDDEGDPPAMVDLEDLDEETRAALLAAN
jgi:hypothetical protein